MFTLTCEANQRSFELGHCKVRLMVSRRKENPTSRSPDGWLGTGQWWAHFETGCLVNFHWTSFFTPSRLQVKIISSNSSSWLLLLPHWFI